LAADPRKEQLIPIQIDVGNMDSKDIIQRPDESREMALAPPIFLPDENGGTIYVLTSKQLHLIREKT